VLGVRVGAQGSGVGGQGLGVRTCKFRGIVRGSLFRAGWFGGGEDFAETVSRFGAFVRSDLLAGWNCAPLFCPSFVHLLLAPLPCFSSPTYSVHMCVFSEQKLLHLEPKARDLAVSYASSARELSQVARVRAQHACVARIAQPSGNSDYTVIVASSAHHIEYNKLPICAP
jgi:hypothetical protein